jgi:hypothetical protein
MMASKENDKPEETGRSAADDVRVLGMRKWASVALSAQGARSTEMARAVARGGRLRDVTLEEMRGSEGEEIAIELVRWLALLFMDGRAPLPEETETLRRMAQATRVRGDAAFRGSVKDRTIARALEIVEYHARRFVAFPGDWAPPPDMLSWSPRQEVANSLAVDLYASVHDGFDCIVPESSTIRNGTLPAEAGERDIQLLDKIGGWLERYEPGPGRPASAGRDEGKLSGAGILEELNALAGSPLGAGLDAHAIANAVNRWNGEPIPKPGT